VICAFHLLLFSLFSFPIMISVLPFLLALGSICVDALPARRDSTSTNATLPNDTVYYTLTLTNGQVSPAGVSRSAILVNGQTPGPTLEMEEGQTLSINVVNNLNAETTLHLHGTVVSLSNLIYSKLIHVNRSRARRYTMVRWCSRCYPICHSIRRQLHLYRHT
jgi:FtsP/CotA-like multicopper oxidase with cupredoxin domain